MKFVLISFVQSINMQNCVLKKYLVMYKIHIPAKNLPSMKKQTSSKPILHQQTLAKLSSYMMDALVGGTLPEDKKEEYGYARAATKLCVLICILLLVQVCRFIQVQAEFR